MLIPTLSCLHGALPAATASVETTPMQLDRESSPSLRGACATARHLKNRFGDLASESDFSVNQVFEVLWKSGVVGAFRFSFKYISTTRVSLRAPNKIGSTRTFFW